MGRVLYAPCDHSVVHSLANVRFNALQYPLHYCNSRCLTGTFTLAMLAAALVLAVPTPLPPAALSGTKLDPARTSSRTSAWALNANECPAGQRNAAASECLAAVQEAAQSAGVEVGSRIKNVDSGSKVGVPPGCSYSRVSKNAIFNVNPAGRSDERYQGKSSEWYQRVCMSESGRCGDAPRIPNLFVGLDNYRLADIVYGFSDGCSLRSKVNELYPDSLAARYLERARDDPAFDSCPCGKVRCAKRTNFTLLAELSEAFLPDGFSEEDWCVLHVRTGDVIDCDEQSVDQMLDHDCESRFNTSAPDDCWVTDLDMCRVRGSGQYWLKAHPGSTRCPMLPNGYGYVRGLAYYTEALRDQSCSQLNVEQSSCKRRRHGGLALMLV